MKKTRDFSKFRKEGGRIFIEPDKSIFSKFLNENLELPYFSSCVIQISTNCINTQLETIQIKNEYIL